MSASLHLATLAVCFGAPFLALRRPKDKLAFDMHFSNAFKGIATILILYHHVRLWFPEDFWFFIFGGDAFFAVSLFYFISGVGLEKSQTLRRYSTLQFIKKRALAIFPTVLFCMLLQNAFYPTLTTMPTEYSTTSLLGLNNWFVVSILTWYVIFIVCDKISNTHLEKSIYLILMSCILWITLQALSEKSSMAGLWARFPFSFALGVIISPYISNFLSMKSSTKTIIFILASSATLLSILSKTYDNQVALASMDVSVSFAAIFALAFLYAMRLTSNLLTFFGKHSLSIYLLQIPLLKYGTNFVRFDNKALDLVVVILVILLSATAVDAAANLVKKRLGAAFSGTRRVGPACIGDAPRNAQNPELRSQEEPPLA